MVSFRGLSAQIVCDGQSLEEYAATSTSGKESEVSCFIVSESGKVRLASVYCPRIMANRQVTVAIHYEIKARRRNRRTCDI